MRKVILLLGICLFVATACPSNKPIIPPTSKPGTEPNQKEAQAYKTYDLQAANISSVTELKDEVWTTLPQSKAEELFGNKLKEAAPIALQLSKDSLLIKLKYDITEKYKINIDDNTIHFKAGDHFYPCGKINDNEVSLKMVFYKMRSAAKARNLSITGQDYGTTPIIHHLDTDREAVVEMLTAEYLFNLK